MKIKLPVKKVMQASGIIMVAAVAICMAAAVLVTKEVLPEKFASIVTRALVLLTVFVMSWRLASKTAKNRMQVAVLVGLLVDVLLLFAGLALFPKYQMSFGLWPVLVILISIFGGLVSGMKRERRR